MTCTPSVQTRSYCRLAQLKKGECATVIGLACSDARHPVFSRTRLMELGFFRGEQVSIVAGTFSEQSPVAVRIGNTVLALGKTEAAMIDVMPDKKRENHA